MRGNGSFFLAVLFLALATPASAQSAVTTVAGGGPASIAARSASVGHPMGIASDKAGNLYIADAAFSRVYKVTAAGTLAVVAGNGSNGYFGDGGPAANAELSAPQGVAVDGSGNIYIADTGNDVVRVVNGKTGIIQSPDIPILVEGASSAIFADSSGNLYLVNTRGCQVFELYAGWSSSRLVAGSTSALTGCGYSGDGGLATNAGILNPRGVFVDASGNVFIADTGNSVIREVVAKTGIIQTVAGNGLPGYSGDGAAATSAALNSPSDVWVDGSGNLFIADTGNNVIRKVTGGKISTVAGNGKAGYTGDGSLALNAMLNSPSALLLDSSGNIYVADQLNSVIREVLASSKAIQTVAGNGQQSDSGDSGAATAAQLNGPAGAFADASGNIYFADQYNNVVREVVAATGKIKTVAGTGVAGYAGDGGLATGAQLSSPAGVFVDPAGNLFIADTRNNAVREVQAATGNIFTVAGNGTPGYSGDGSAASGAQLQGPAAVAVDHAGNLFVADTGNNVIREVTAANGQIKTVAGSGTWGYGGDGSAATSARLKSPNAILVDSSGNLFFADSGNNAIREVVASSGKILPVAGNGTQGYSGDSGLATNANLNSPSGIFMDGGGNLFIADSANHVIREVAAKSQIITTIAGTGTAGYLDSSTPLSAQFDFPTGLAGDPLGNLFVGDSKNQRIRKIAGAQGTDVIPMAAPPTFSPGAGIYPAAQKVTLSDAIKGATMYYTTNGAAPTASSTKYTAPITASNGTTINAVAIASGYSLSPVAQAAYTISSTVPAPTFLPLPGTYIGTQQVVLADALNGAVIHYTTNGSTPTAASTPYTKPIPVSASSTIKAIATATGFSASPLSTGPYVIQPFIAAPTFTPAPQGYWATQSVTLQDATAGTTIYYTLDGSTPTAKSTKYAGKAIPISTTTTIHAIAFAADNAASAVATGLYTITDPKLLEQRVMAQEGIGVQLATQTFLSQISLAFNVLGPTIGMGRASDGTECGMADFLPELFPLGPTDPIGGSLIWTPTSPDAPGYATLFYDSKCTKPWMNAELDSWMAEGDLFNLSAATNETATLIGKNGSPLGTMNITEAAGLSLSMDPIAWSSTAYGLGTFTPEDGAPPAQLGLTCSIDLVQFFYEGEAGNCNGAIAQDYPKLGLSLGFVVPLSFTPVITPGVAWTGMQFIAVSAAGAILTSPNGTTWTARTSGTGKNLRAVAASGSLLVAVGAGGTIITSKDGGTTWTPQASGTTNSLASVLWSGSQFVAVGWNGTILTSPNGTTWTTRTSGTKFALQGLAASGTILVATGMYGVVLTSPDGVTWTPQTALTHDGLVNVIWSGSQFVGVDEGGYIALSTDGKKWAYTGASIENNLRAVTWSPQKKLFVLVGDYGMIMTSPDASVSSWTAQNSNTSYSLHSVAWSGSQFVAIGSANTVVTSPDGVTWTVQSAVPGTGQLVHFSSATASAVTGPPGALKMSAPTIQSLAISGGTPYGGATFTGYLGDLSIFPPTPNGWTATDAAHDQQFHVTLSDNTNRMLSGAITAISNGKTLATFTLDQSGTGTLTYSDATSVAVTDWLPAD